MKIKNLKLNKYFNKFIVIILLTSVFISSTVMSANAHDAYFLSVTVDSAKYKYQSIVTYDDAFTEGGHKEVELGDFASKNRDWKSIKVPEVPAYLEQDERSKQYTDVGNGDGSNGLIYSFPGIHTNSLWASTNANDMDRDRAQWVAENLTTGFNDALSFIFYNINLKLDKESNSRNLFIGLSAGIANKSKEAMVNGSSSMLINGVTVSFSRANDIKQTAYGVESSDYIRITANGNTGDFIYKVKKGYINGPLTSQVADKVKSDVNSKDSEYLSWSHLALQGNYNYDVKNIAFSNVSEITKPGKIEQMINDLLNSIITGLRQLLGLYSMQELMLNEGSRATTHFYGIMPTSWFNSAMVLHVICQFLAWALLIGAIVKLLISRSVATINTSMRISLIEGAQDILITGLALAVILPAFYIIATLNYKLVAVFAKASDSVALFGGNMESGYGGIIAGIIVMFIYFIINIYFNFMYIMRALTVSVLIALAPLFVVSIAFGGKYKQMFGNFVKELVGHTFMQSIHAVLIAFSSSIFAGGGMRLIYSIVVAYSFVPLTSFVQKNLLGLSDGFAGKTAGNLLSTATSLVSSSFAGGGKKESPEKSKKADNNGINTTSSDKIKENQRNATGITNNPNSGSNQLYSKGTSGENDYIPNSELSKNSLSDKIKDTISSSKAGQTISKAGQKIDSIKSSTGGRVAGAVLGKSAKVLGNTVKGLTYTGVALGASSVGDKMTAHNSSRLAGKNFREAVGGSTEIANDVGYAYRDGNSKDLDDYLAQDSGYMYHNELGDGFNEYHLNSEKLEEDTGISGIQDVNNKEVAMEYDYEEEEFENQSLNNATEYKENFRDMVNAFKNNDEEAIARYKLAGINNVSTKNGKVKVTYAKDKIGLRKISKSGGKTIMEMSENNDFRLQNLIPDKDKLPTNKKEKVY